MKNSETEQTAEPKNRSRKSFDLQAKWGDSLTNICKAKTGLGGYIPVVRSYLRLYHKMKISPQAAMTAIHILDSKWTKDHPWARTSTLAKSLGKSESQTKKYIAELKKAGVKYEYKRKEQKYVFDFTGFFESLFRVASDEIEAIRKKREESSYDN